MTATATPVSQAVAEWTRIFPRQVTENYTSSVTFMKQLTVIAVSTISYLKNAFPEDSYTVENFAGVKLRILKKKCKDDLAQFLSTALTQAFDAFDKKYLHQLAICFYEEECEAEKLVEYHLFEYTYTAEGVSMEVRSQGRAGSRRVAYSFDGVRERTVHLIRACVVVMQACQQDLPASYDVSLRLYYNKDAPEEYQAPGFQSTRHEARDPLAASRRDTFRLGCVETNHHRLVARSYVKDSMASSHEANPSQNPPEMEKEDDHDFTGSRSPSRAGLPSLACPCNLDDQLTSITVLLTCNYCSRQQHAACFGLVGALPPRHCCLACSEGQHPPLATDPRLAALPLKKRECLCIVRLTLAWSSSRDSISGRELMSLFRMSAVNASKLVKMLASQGIIATADSDLTTPHKIIPDQLKLAMTKYFQTNKQEDIVDRLMAETLASQEQQSDPIGDVLGHMEKVTLHNDSQVGRLIDNPELNETVIIEDSTIKQYREAILSNDKMEEELPLSGSHNPVKDVEKIGKKKAGKRKAGEDMPLRSGVKTKKARTLPH